MKTILLLLFTLNLFLFTAQKKPHLITSSDSLDKDAFVNTIQQSLNLFYADYAKNNLKYDSIIKILNYEPKETPTFSDEVYCERLETMSSMTPFHMDCNAATLSTLKFFVDKRRSFIQIALGRSSIYFDMFKEKLVEYGLPIELRFLSVIESGLRPQVKSKAGALGLWQFMYKTGLYFGLTENSYIDERMDPHKATDAACRYLKQLYGIYGDWNLALASYNAGPGNVNKAIKRSGNKKTYWEVRPFLPTETQGYVPNFIAAAYLMTYHAEHNIIPIEAKLHNAQLDTICFNKAIHMNTISKLVSWDLEEMKVLNPIYKTIYIPKTSPPQCITGPMEKIYSLAGLEDSLYSLEKSIYYPVKVVPVVPKPTLDPLQLKDSIAVVDTLLTPEKIDYYIVSTGDNLKNIALKFNVTVEQLMEWNTLQTTNIYVGQKLKLNGENTLVKPTPKPQVKPTPKPTPKTPEKPTPKPTKKYYEVKSGDSASRVAKKFDLTLAELERLNSGVSLKVIKTGQKLRIK
jgi:membrane-bound lytic murein transglycosylase D